MTSSDLHPAPRSVVADKAPSGRILSPESVKHLLHLLDSRSWTVDEWLEAALSKGRRAPDHVVPRLLDAALADRTHREHLLTLAGSHGQELAARTPQWAALRRDADVDVDDEPWRAGTHPQRLQWLTVARALDPVAALTRLEHTWNSEGGEHRADFVATLESRVNTADESFLERALDDPHKLVRERAVQLLRRLPDSRYACRMARRARTWIRVETKPLRRRLVVRVPGSLDDWARRDGIEDVHFKNKGIRGWWLRMVVAATPLSVWEDMIGSASGALDIPIEDRWRSVMTEAWLGATVAQRNSRWAEAFLRRDGRELDRRLASLVRPETLDAYVGSGAADKYLLGVDGRALLDSLRHPWTPTVARRVVAELEKVAARQAWSGQPLGANSRQNHHTVLRSAETHVPLAAARLFDAAADRAADPDWKGAFAAAAATVERRRSFLAELG